MWASLSVMVAAKLLISHRPLLFYRIRTPLRVGGDKSMILDDDLHIDGKENDLRVVQPVREWIFASVDQGTIGGAVANGPQVAVEQVEYAVHFAYLRIA